MSAQSDKFAPLFDKPTIEAMHALSSRDFERFVAYVLRRGGYVVNEVGLHFLRGVDLEMRLPNKQRIFGGVECKKFAPRNPVRARVVMGLLGAPAIGRGAKPFVVTTSDSRMSACLTIVLNSNRTRRRTTRCRPSIPWQRL
jgi:restriction endonuclease